VTTPPVAPLSTEPWIDVEVRIKSGAYASRNAIVKHVRSDGRGSLRLAIYVPSLLRTLEVDLFTVVELRYVYKLFLPSLLRLVLCRTGQLLLDYQPLQSHQLAFKVLPELKVMRTSRVPWLGMKVQITAGEYKGQCGIVRDVNRYRYDTRRPKRCSLLAITLERLVIGPSSQLVKLDYDDVRYFGYVLTVCLLEVLFTITQNKI
jgi:hypothetical protein